MEYAFPKVTVPVEACCGCHAVPEGTAALTAGRFSVMFCCSKSFSLRKDVLPSAVRLVRLLKSSMSGEEEPPVPFCDVQTNLENPCLLWTLVFALSFTLEAVSFPVGLPGLGHCRY